MRFYFAKANIFSLCIVGPGRNGTMFVMLRDDVHNFIGACRKELDAGKDLYNVVREYGAKRQACRAVSYSDFLPTVRWGAERRDSTLG
jgi:hypothetical protein